MSETYARSSSLGYLLGGLQERIRSAIVPLPATASYLREGESILEIGCGEGLFLALAASRFARLVGVDIDQRKLERARARLQDVPAVDFRAADAFDFLASTPDHAFSTVALVDTLSSFRETDQLRLLCEAVRVIEPGGVLLLKHIDSHVPIKSQLSRLLSSVIYRALRLSLSADQRFTYRKSQDLAEALTKFDLHVHIHELHRSSFHPIPHVLILATKPPANSLP